MLNKNTDDTQTKIDNCNKTISHLKYLLNDYSKNSLILKLDKLRDCESMFCIYRNSIKYRYFGYMPSFKKRYDILKHNYISSFNDFKNQIDFNLSPLEDFSNFDTIKKQLLLGNYKNRPSSGKTQYSHDTLACKNLYFGNHMLLHETCYDDCLEIVSDYYDQIHSLLKSTKLELKNYKTSKNNIQKEIVNPIGIHK